MAMRRQQLGGECGRERHWVFPSQWVLGHGIRLPHNMLPNSGRLSLHTRNTSDKGFSECVAMMSPAQRAQIAMRNSKSISHDHCATPWGGAQPAQFRILLEDQLYYWRGNSKAKAELCFCLAWPCSGHRV